MIYDDYVRRLAERASKSLSDIDPIGSNLEFGPEFELAVYRWLEGVLPSKYGVAFGYAVTLESEKAGDDLLIYDRVNFPWLRGQGEPNAGRKDRIPAEAVYGYVEAKHSLIVEGADESGSATFATAVRQVADAKATLEKRPAPRPPRGAMRWQKVGCPRRDDWPFGVIVCRHVRLAKGKDPLQDGAEVADALFSALRESSVPPRLRPNLIIAGSECVLFPVASLPGERKGEMTDRPVPFTTDETRHGAYVFTNSLAYGVGLAMLLDAFEQVILPPFSWHRIINDALSDADARLM